MPIKLLFSLSFILNIVLTSSSFADYSLNLQEDTINRFLTLEKCYEGPGVPECFDPSYGGYPSEDEDDEAIIAADAKRDADAYLLKLRQKKAEELQEKAAIKAAAKKDARAYLNKLREKQEEKADMAATIKADIKAYLKDAKALKHAHP